MKNIGLKKMQDNLKYKQLWVKLLQVFLGININVFVPKEILDH